MIGVLKSIFQVIVGLFLFDRFSITINTVIGIALSLLAGTLFSYFEYTAKHSKSTTSMKSTDCEQQSEESTKTLSNTQEKQTNLEKFVHILIVKSRQIFTQGTSEK